MPGVPLLRLVLHVSARRAAVVPALLALVGLASSCAPAAAAAPGASARVVLVELFTSQGCSSCPAAEAFLGELPRLGLGPDRVAPLAFHVTYWDDLGWKDPFALPAFTARQHSYVNAHRLASPAGEEGIDGAYTPQMIVDGRVHFSGARRDVALAEIARAAARPPEAELDVEAARAADQVQVVAQVRAGPGVRGPTAGWMVRAAVTDRAERTAVTRGENAGRTVEGAAIVRALESASAPAGGAPVRLSVGKPKDLPWDQTQVVVFVQASDTSRVLVTRVVRVLVR